MTNFQEYYNDGDRKPSLSGSAFGQITYSRLDSSNSNTNGAYYSPLTSGTSTSRADKSTNWRPKRSLTSRRKINENELDEGFAGNRSIEANHGVASNEQKINSWLSQANPPDIIHKQEQQQTSITSNSGGIMSTPNSNYSKAFMSSNYQDNWPSYNAAYLYENNGATQDALLGPRQLMSTFPPPGLLFDQRFETQQHSLLRKDNQDIYDNNPFMSYTASSLYPSQAYNQYLYQQTLLAGERSRSVTATASSNGLDSSYSLYGAGAFAKQRNSTDITNTAQQQNHQLPLANISNNYTTNVTAPAYGLQQDTVKPNTVKENVNATLTHFENKNKATWSNIVANSNRRSTALITPQQNHLGVQNGNNNNNNNNNHMNTGSTQVPHFNDNATLIIATATQQAHERDHSATHHAYMDRLMLLANAAGLPTNVVSSTNKTPRYISDSIYFLASKLSNSLNDTTLENKTSDGGGEEREDGALTQTHNRSYTVIKITNLPWSIHSSDIRMALERNSFIIAPPEAKLPQNVHILMDVKTGKTTGTAYAEVIIPEHFGLSIENVLNSIAFQPVQGRRIKFVASSYGELCQDLFTAWNKGFLPNGLAILTSSSAAASEITSGVSDNSLFQSVNGGAARDYAQDGEAIMGVVAAAMTDSEDDSLTATTTSDVSTFFIEQKELQCILNICRHYKICYNRKCAERPFEYLMSIVANLPWKQPKSVTTIQRDIIYECFKLVTAALHEHTTRNLHSFDKDVLPRMIRTALLCDGFTAKQKSGILTSSHLACPKDLQIYLQEPLILNDLEVVNMIR